MQVYRPACGIRTARDSVVMTYRGRVAAARVCISCLPLLSIMNRVLPGEDGVRNCRSSMGVRLSKIVDARPKWMDTNRWLARELGQVSYASRPHWPQRGRRGKDWGFNVVFGSSPTAQTAHGRNRPYYLPTGGRKICIAWENLHMDTGPRQQAWMS